MRRALGVLVALTSLWACGGSVLGSPGDDGGTDASSSSSGSGSSGGSTSSGGGSSSSGSGGGSGSSGGGSSGGRVPVNHRPDDAQCQTTPPPGSCNLGSSSGAFMCSSDAQCADAGINGRCITGGGGPAYCGCTSDRCFHDNDCTGDTCACHGSPYMGGAGNTCVPGNCHVDSDCGPGGYCSPTYGPQDCGGLAGYYCHTPSDQCIDDTDCTDGGYSVCAYSTTDAHWECQLEALCQ